MKTKNSNIQLKLNCYSNGKQLYSFKLNKNKLLVGSAEHADIQINDQTISHYHALIYITPELDGFQIIDLQSINGIFVNEKKVDQSFVNTDDKLKLGTFQFIIEEDHSEKVSESSFINTETEVELISSTSEVTNGLKPIEGFTVIDGEYCDITFSDYTEKQTLNSLKTKDIASSYVDNDI